VAVTGDTAGQRNRCRQNRLESQRVGRLSGGLLSEPASIGG